MLRRIGLLTATMLVAISAGALADDTQKPAITVAMYGKGTEIDQLRPWFNDYALSHQIDITFVNQPYDQFEAAMAAAPPADLYIVDQRAIGPIASRQVAMPLDGQLSKDLQARIDQLPAQTKSLFVVGGKRYAVPYAIEGSAVAIHKRLLMDAGLPVPAGLDWNQFETYAKKLTQPDKQQWGINLDAPAATGWLDFVYAAGGSLFDQKGTTATANQGGSKSAFAWLQKLSKDGVSPSADAVKKLVPADAPAAWLFATRHTAMAVLDQRALWSVLATGEQAGYDFDFAYLPVPTPDGKPGGSVRDAWGLSINPNSKYKKQALDLAQWLVDEHIPLTGTDQFKDNQMALWDTTNLSPFFYVGTDAISFPQPWLDSMLNGRTLPPFPNSFTWGVLNQAQPAALAVIDGQKSVDDGLKALNTALSGAAGIAASTTTASSTSTKAAASTTTAATSSSK